MRLLLLYPYPLEPDGLSLQGHYLAKGFKDLGIDFKECDRDDEKTKNKIYKEFKPDAVIGIGFWGNSPELILNPLKKDITPVPWLNANGWVANYQETLNKLPLIIATSNWVKSTYIRDGVSGENIKVCGIGFDPEIFKPKPRSESMKIREELGIKDNEIMIFTAGGDVTSKGAQEMFKALAKIKDKIPDWKYVLKTYPSFSAENHGKEENQLINELGLDKERIIYLSEECPPEKMASLINACDIYAAPSRLEGFGMIQLEAQACGKPVISINIGGPKDIILNNETGFLADVEHEIKLDKEWVYPNMGFAEKRIVDFPIPKTFAWRANIDQLADYTLRLAKDKDLRKTMGEKAAKHALENFHYKVIAKRIITLIEDNL
jgi:alpha-maltose-1-phosphate synthase